MEKEYEFLEINYDRSHLNSSSYNVDILVDLHTIFDSFDLLVMIINLICFFGIIGLYVCIQIVK